MVQCKDPLVIDCVPSILKGSIHRNKKVDPFYMTESQAELKKLIHINQLKNKLQLVYLKSDYRPLKESWLIITITGPTVANKKDQNSK